MGGWWTAQRTLNALELLAGLLAPAGQRLAWIKRPGGLPLRRRRSRTSRCQGHATGPHHLEPVGGGRVLRLRRRGRRQPASSSGLADDAQPLEARWASDVGRPRRRARRLSKADGAREVQPVLRRTRDRGAAPNPQVAAGPEAGRTQSDGSAEGVATRLPPDDEPGGPRIRPGPGRRGWTPPRRKIGPLRVLRPPPGDIACDLVTCPYGANQARLGRLRRPARRPGEPGANWAQRRPPPEEWPSLVGRFGAYGCGPQLAGAVPTGVQAWTLANGTSHITGLDDARHS